MAKSVRLSRWEPVIVTSVPGGPLEGLKDLIDGGWACIKSEMNSNEIIKGSLVDIVRIK